MLNEDNKLIIIGNGFDLHCGLKTNCIDFQKYLIESNSDFLNSNFFAILFHEIYIARSYSNEYCSHNPFVFTEYQTDEIKENIDGSRWDDIEGFLFDFLTGTNYCNLFSDISEAFENYSFDTNECVLTKMMQNKLRPIFLKYENIDFYDFLLGQLKEYEMQFSKYLDSIDKKEVIEKKKDLLLNICGLKKSIYTQNIGSVISFNYTAFPYQRVGHFSYVHGSAGYRKLAEVKRASPIIIGIDYAGILEILKNPKHLKRCLKSKVFSKTYRKLKLEEGVLKNGFVMPSKKYLTDIMFYGHSLGKQDYSYFQSIFDYYSIYDSKVTITFCYSEYDYVDKYDSKTVVHKSAEEVEKELNEAVFELINKYGNTFDNKDHGSNLLHKLLLENRIKLKYID